MQPHVFVVARPPSGETCWGVGWAPLLRHPARHGPDFNGSSFWGNVPKQIDGEAHLGFGAHEFNYRTLYDVAKDRETQIPKPFHESASAVKAYNREAIA